MDASSLIGKTLSHYEVTGLIGQGGMGVVYRARDLRLERDVALKVLRAGALGDEVARKRFRTEALSLSRLNHPNIATIHDFDSEGEIDFVVMECIAGEPLSEHVRTTSLTEKQTIAVGIQIAAALEAAHEKGVVHRDLKPQNIILAAQGQVKVVDFGLAKVIHPGSDADATVTMTVTETQAGTLPYMSPEQVRGDAADARSDIWSAGAVLYEVSTAQRPFPEDRSALLIDAILNKQPAPPRMVNPRISAGLEQIILKALDKEPSRRYQSAREMRVDLERLAEGRQTAADSARASALRRRAAALWAVAAAAVIVGALIGIHWWEASPKPQVQQTVLVGEFVNRTNNPVFDLTLAELLKTALEESRMVNVFPESRVPDVLQRMEKPPAAPIDEAVGREICAREGLRAVVLGSISSLGPSYLILVRAVDAGGRDLISRQETIPNLGQVSTAMDTLAEEIRRALGEPASSVKEASAPLAQVTSGSLEAIQDYTLGYQRVLAGDPEGSIVFFRKALDLDPSFAMAKEGMGIAYTNLNDSSQAEEYLRDATGGANRVTEVEKQKILGNYNMIAGNFDQACADFQILTQLQPLDPSGFISLGWCEGFRYHFDAAIANTEKAVALLPSARAKINLAMLHFLNGDTAKAMELYDEVLKEQPKSLQARQIKGTALLLMGKVEDARAIFKSMIEEGGNSEVTGLSELADLGLATGHYREARSTLEAYRFAAQKQKNSEEEAKADLLTAEFTPGGQVPPASPLRSMPWMEKHSAYVLLLGRLYAAHHDVKGAEEMARVMESVSEKRDTAATHASAFLLQAEVAIVDGKPLEAVEAARKAIEYVNSPIAVETLARAFEAAGKYQESAAEYEKVLARASQRSASPPPIGCDSPSFHKVVEVYYRLGIVYETLGRSGDSKKELVKFLSYWSKADSDLGIYKDAVTRLRTAGARTGPSSGMPTPATYSADSVIPSTRRSRSIRDSLNTAVQNGAIPNQVATRQNVWQAWPASRSTIR
jgi:tetratricopeptide (TPR) repeat protein/tRNA A-37 threonylcarbamoyl transferase component Bud32